MAIKSLVTGGAGFIGSNLALTLEKLGHEVVVVDNFQFADRTNLNVLLFLLLFRYYFSPSSDYRSQISQ
ncbi:MAG: NAD-dependent epimerase/dehydratase family protein [Proteobacteria bacterium]|nr:NAD-dependent epimerase/dehydratase family protein [Pseudomonadota bacterium]